MTDDKIEGMVQAMFPEGYKGYALEIGACDGIYLTNTLQLEKSGWDVLCIEPNPEYFAALKNNRKIALNYACDRKDSDDVDLLIYGRKGIPEIGWAAGEPISTLEALTPEYIESFCPDIRPPIFCKVKVRTLDHCLEEAGFPRLDFLSLDVDGIESDVLAGFDIKRWQTTVVCVENPFDNPEINDYLKDAGMEIVDSNIVNQLWKAA